MTEAEKNEQEIFYRINPGDPERALSLLHDEHWELREDEGSKPTLPLSDFCAAYQVVRAALCHDPEEVKAAWDALRCAVFAENHEDGIDCLTWCLNERCVDCEETLGPKCRAAIAAVLPPEPEDTK